MVFRRVGIFLEIFFGGCFGWSGALLVDRPLWTEQVWWFFAGCVNSGGLTEGAQRKAVELSPRTTFPSLWGLVGGGWLVWAPNGAVKRS